MERKDASSPRWLKLEWKMKDGNTGRRITIIDKDFDGLTERGNDPRLQFAIVHSIDTHTRSVRRIVIGAFGASCFAG